MKDSIKSKMLPKMITFIILSVWLFILFSSIQFDNEENSIKRAKNASVYKVDSLKIEGCEYLLISVSRENFLFSHKGNCKNPIHFKNK